MSDHDERAGASSRREFLTTAAAAGSAAALLGSGNFAFAQGSDQVKVGLIGCGGRGTGAAVDALQADRGAYLTAMGDVFPENLARSLKALKGHTEAVKSVAVSPNGLLIASGSADKTVRVWEFKK